MLLNRFLPRTEFESYEDFKQNYKVNVPENFNFGFDIVDAWADEQPGKMALLYCDDFGTRRYYTFTDMKKMSNRIANYLLSLGIKKGDTYNLKELNKRLSLRFLRALRRYCHIIHDRGICNE